ncbi:MAG: peptide-methionine (R)-S-oxide reductase MsrB [Natrialbaceae archaeon]|nr:peptide-methionine (R)-S-oxide reductase MsrB [Natrialbaceae archaeon]
MPEKTDLPDSPEEWREILSEDEYKVLREAGTEPAFSGEYVETDDEGTFRCAGCGANLFDSETKFKSGSGWPSFSDVPDGRIETQPDNTHGMQRTEVVCARCGGHLGHVFEDGPEPTGLRYCINSVALEFDAEQ